MALKEPAETSKACARTAPEERGAVISEYRAIKAGAGFAQLGDRLLIRVTGEDRVSFLHGMCTADIKGLPPRQAAAGLFVTERAHLLADCFVYTLDDALLLEVERAVWPAVRTHLERFLVADDVELEAREELVVIDCEGPATGASLVSSGLLREPLAAWHCAPDAPMAHLPRLAGPAYTLIIDRKEAAEVAARLRAGGLRELSAAAREIVRVERGLARVGVDTTERTLALEARLESAISLSKGCYIGQETLERATARGGIKRRLCGLRMAEPGLPARGASVTLQDRPVGVLTSVVESPDCGIIGLGILQQGAWPPTTAVVVHDPAAGAIVGHVAELPFIGA